MTSKILSLCILLLLLIFACNPKEEIAPENPCDGYIQPHAGFIMEETTGEVDNKNDYVWYANPFVDKDVLKLGGIFQFRSMFKDTNVYKHTWYIGSEVLHNFKEWRNFDDVRAPSNIVISHVMKWKPNTFCNPNKTGYDSVSFTFKITDRLKELGSFGQYRMVYDTAGAPSIKDTVDVELYKCRTNFKDSIIQEPLDNDDFSEFRIKGLFAGELSPSWVRVPSNEIGLNGPKFISNSYARFTYAGGLLLYLKIDIDKNNKAFIEYYTRDPNNLLYIKKYVLKGRKINK